MTTKETISRYPCEEINDFLSASESLNYIPSTCTFIAENYLNFLHYQYRDAGAPGSPPNATIAFAATDSDIAPMSEATLIYMTQKE